MYVGLALSRRLEMTHAWRSVKYARAQLVWRPETHSTVQAVAGGFAVFAGDSSPLSRAAGLGLHGPVTDIDLEHVEQFFLSRQATPRSGSRCKYNVPGRRERPSHHPGRGPYPCRL